MTTTTHVALHHLTVAVLRAIPMDCVLKVQTPDGRSWRVTKEASGLGRSSIVSYAGFTLVELDGKTEHEHEPTDERDELWNAGDMIDYLRAVSPATR